MITSIAITILLFIFGNVTGSKGLEKVYENHIALEDEDNMRDLGGFVGQDERRVLYRKLFRSGELSKLTEADKDTLTALGIEQIIDLRTASEREELPDKVPEDIIRYNLPLNVESSSSHEEFERAIINGWIDAEEAMVDFFANIDSIKLVNWKKFFDLIEENKSTLLHCTAGKDRAGMTTALVLVSLGVDRDTIIKDFMASNTYLSESIEEIVDSLDSLYGNNAGELLRPLHRVEEDYILAFLDEIDTRYGSIDAFLAELDVDIEKIQANFLEK